jgi:hypothetical protein
MLLKKNLVSKKKKKKKESAKCGANQACNQVCPELICSRTFSSNAMPKVFASFSRYHLQAA